MGLMFLALALPRGATEKEKATEIIQRAEPAAAYFPMSCAPKIVSPWFIRVDLFLMIQLMMFI